MLYAVFMFADLDAIEMYILKSTGHSNDLGGTPGSTVFICDLVSSILT